jgi:uncharacterized protein (TIGR03435 family)
MQAYGVSDYQIAGLPDWAKSPRGERYDMDAKPKGRRLRQ